MKSSDLLARFLFWRVKHVNDKSFILIMSGVIGAIAGFAAVSLKASVHFIQYLLAGGPTETVYEKYLHFFYPLVGILLTVIFSRYLLKEKLGHGITDVLFSISQKSSIMRASKTYSRMISSALTVGFGGSVGLEAPIVVTGSAIGSNMGQLMHLGYKKRTLLIGCGAAGAIAGIFNSPVAGVIFSIEVMLTEISISAFIPLLIASVCGSLVSLALLGDDILFSFQLQDEFTAADTPYYFLLGIFCGLISLYFTRISYQVEPRIQKIKNYLLRGSVGGLLLGLIILIYSPIYGEGYETIKALINGEEHKILQHSLFFNDIDNSYFILFYLLCIILIKPVASSLTIGAGGSGGIFAPSLFIGGITGFLFAKLVNLSFLTDVVSLSNFTLVGMCGVMSGILHAPLTGIFLIAEITSGYTLFVPLMLVSAISYNTITYFEKYSIYTKKLIERGQLITDDKDRLVLSQIDLTKIIEHDLLKIHPDATLNDLVKLVKRSRRNIFPVVDENEELQGIITLDDIREIMFEEDKRHSLLVRSLMSDPPDTVSPEESMKVVMNKFERSGVWNLPVIDEGKYIGFISKSRIFNAYRHKLIWQQKNI